MRSQCLTSALRGALCLFILYAHEGRADTITTWVGGNVACPTCWNLAANWTNGIPNGAFSATINSGGSQPILDINPSIDNLTMSGGILTAPNGSLLTINTANTGGVSSINNAGTLLLAGPTASLALSGAGGTVNLSGSGTITMNSPNNSIFANNSGMTLNNNSTIQGSGFIGTAGNAFQLNNNSGGIINANNGNPLTLGSTIVNGGLLEATNGGTLLLTNTFIDNTSGTIGASGAGSVVQFNGANIIGGTLQSTGGGLFNSTGTSALSSAVTLNGVLNVANGSVLQFNTNGGTMALNIGAGGGLHLNSTGNNTDLALVGTNGFALLNGPLTLSNNANNRIYANNTGMTLLNNSTIQGAGQIGAVGQVFSLHNNAAGVINSNVGTLILNAPVVNAGLLEATNGATLSLGSQTIGNTNGTISATGAGSLVLLNGTTIGGGTLQGSGGGLFNATGASLNGTVALNGILNVANASSLTLNATSGPMTLNIGAGGGLNLNSTGNNTDLVLQGTNGIVNLNGPVTLSNNANNRIYANSSGMTLNNSSTIQGAGQIGLVGQPISFNNNGTVNANQSAGLSLTGTIVNTSGLLEATNGGTLTLSGTLNNTGSTITANGANTTLRLTNDTVTNANGVISATGAGSSVQLNGATIRGGTISAGGGASFGQSGAYSSLSGTVALNGVLNVANNSGINLDATGSPMTLNIGAGGGLNLNASGSNTDLVFAGTGGTVNLNGPVTLSNNANNRIYANSSGMTLNNNSSIQGAGQIGLVGQGFTLNNNATGVINANLGTLILNSPTTNAGLLEATNGATLSLGSQTIGNTGGTITASGAGSLVLLNGTTISGGTLQGSGGGQFNSTGNSTLNGTIALNGILNVANASSLTLNATSGPMTLNIGAGGGLNLNSTGSNTDLILQGTNGTVNLNGPVTLSGNINNRIYATSTGMTLNNNSTIQGSGQIGVVGQPLSFNNTGTVNANQFGGLSLSGTVVNTSGLLEATNGSTLTLSGTVNNTGSTITANGAFTTLKLTNDVVTNANGTISANGTGSLIQLNGATIRGGTIQAGSGATFSQSGSFSTLGGTVALNGLLSVANASGLTLDATGGPMTLNIGAGGGINFNSTGSNTDLTLTGSNGIVNLNGPVSLSNNANNRIYAANSGMTLNNNSTIQGAGQIGAVGQVFTFNNNASGVVNSNLGTLILNAPVTNAGLLEATNGATLSMGSQTIGNAAGTISVTGAGSQVLLNGTTITGGALQGSVGGRFTSTGNSTLIGTIGLTGPLNVTNASTLTLNATSGPMTLNIGTGGGLNLNSSGSNTDLTLLGTNGTVNLNGPVTLSNSANNRIYASSTGMTLNNSGTVQGSGQIGVVGQAFTFHNTTAGTLIANQSNPLTVGSVATFSNAGTVESAAGSALQIDGAFTNFSNHTLTGGTYVAGGIIAFTNADVVNNAANITMIGPGEIEDQNSINGLRNFVDNMVPGVFALEGGANFTAPGAFTNAGIVDIFGGTPTASQFSTGGAAYTQTSGTTQVDGTLTAGAVNINGGHLKGAGTVNGNVTVSSGGAVDPGDSPGTLTIHGNYNQLSGGALDLQFAGSGAGQFSVLDISGAANLSGTLNLTALAGFLPFNGERFDVMNFASRTGTFTTVNGLNLGNGFTFALEYNATDVVLDVNGPQQSAPEPGTWMLFGIGVVAIAVSRYRRARV